MALDELARIRSVKSGEAPRNAAGRAGRMARAGSLLTRRNLVIAAIGAVALFAGGYFLLSDSTDSAGGPVIVAATRGDIEDSVTALGALQPKDYVDVGAQVSGQLKTIAVKIGDQVTKGQFLAEIDSTVQAAKVQSDRDLLTGLQATLADKIAQATVTAAQEKRQLGLLKIGGTSRDAYQLAQAAARSAAAQVNAVKAQIAQAQSQLNGDLATFGYSKIYAPIAGTVVSITAMQGQTLNAAQQAPIILRVADLSTMTVWTQVSEADVPKLRVGMDAYFTTLGSQDHRWYGKLQQILPTPTVVNNVVLYTALFDVDNPRGQLMPQMTAQVFFVTASAHNVITVPVAALHYGKPGAQGHRRAAGNTTPAAPTAPTDAAQTQAPGAAHHHHARTPGAPRNAWVTVVKDDGTAEARQVKVGVSSRVSAEIVSGLAEGERVIAGTKDASSSSDAGSQRRSGGGGRGRGGIGRIP